MTKLAGSWLLWFLLSMVHPLAAQPSTTFATVMEHYSSESDSLKRQAARFLLANMEGHGYVLYELRDSTGTPVDFDALDYETYEQLEDAFDSLESRHGVLDFERATVKEDPAEITAEFLIHHIDLAFQAWRERPWARFLSFDPFCEYVLPYRGSEEPLEEWREPLYARYDSIVYQMKDSTDPVEAAVLINRGLMSWFRFDPRYYYHPIDQGYSEMLRNRRGRCEDMTNLTIYAMRANGLAVTSDFTPYWANAGNNHAWNAIVTANGSVIPFMGAEANPGEYRLANKLAKVYRKTYSMQKDNLAFQPRRQEEMPRYLLGKSYVDVTAAYVPVQDVTVHLNGHGPDSVDIAYLCVFNSGEWQPIHWGRIRGDSVVFTDMGVDVAYLPGIYIEKKIRPMGAPFILSKDSTIHPLNPNDKERTTLRLAGTTRSEMKASTEGSDAVRLTRGREYELCFWKDGWQPKGTATASDEPLEFKEVPAGGLYWLVAKNSDHEERIFTYENEKQIWW